MRKDAPLAFRITTTLKKNLDEIARREARSVSQVCEMMLTIGVETYQKEGSQYFQRFLAYRKPKASE